MLAENELGEFREPLGAVQPIVHEVAEACGDGRVCLELFGADPAAAWALQGAQAVVPPTGADRPKEATLRAINLQRAAGVAERRLVLVGVGVVGFQPCATP